MNLNKKQEFSRFYNNFLSKPYDWSSFVRETISSYPDMINELDEHGNSILSHFVNTCHTGCSEHDLYRELLTNGAKYIRDYIEEKPSLNMNLRFIDWELQVDLPPDQRKIDLQPCTDDSSPDNKYAYLVERCISQRKKHFSMLWSNWDKHIGTLSKSTVLDQQDLQQGRTALHYAILSGKYFVAQKLVQAGASCTIRDKFQKSPIDYAVLSGNVDLVKTMLAKLGIGHNLLLNSAKRGVSLITQACYSGNFAMYELIEKSAIKTALDQVIIDMLFEPKFEQLNILDVNERLLAVSAITSLFPQHHDYGLKYIKQHIVPMLVSASESEAKTLRKGMAYGIEVEVSGMPVATIVPIDLLSKALNVNNVYDGSIKGELLMHLSYNEHKANAYSQRLKELEALPFKEFTSPILDSTIKVKEFLVFTKYLRDSGAIVNKSTGMHIHVNIRGGKQSGLPSITAGLHIKNREVADVELDVVKQILCNWSRLEPGLQKFLRYGELITSDDNWRHNYARVLGSDIQILLEEKTLEDLIMRLPSRNRALNLHSLHSTSHGTIEFRMHEGTVEPELIKAWLNLVHRLVSISLDQVNDRISNEITDAFQPYANIEQLIDLLHIERNYEQTWDKEWKAPVSASILPGDANIPIRDMAPRLPLYDAFKTAKYIPASNDTTDQAVVNMLELDAKYPGVIDGYGVVRSTLDINYGSGECKNFQPNTYGDIQLPAHGRYGFDLNPVQAQIENYTSSAFEAKPASLLFLGGAALVYLLRKKLSAYTRPNKSHSNLPVPRMQIF